MDMKKHDKTLLAALLAMMIGWGCTGKKTQQQPTESDTMVVEVSTPDSTVYGVCGEGTSMHALELLTDEGDTLTYLVDADTEQEAVKGGLFTGDRMAVVGYKGAEGDMVATCAVNLTTLMGKWTSIDKNFEIQEGGLVESSIKPRPVRGPHGRFTMANCCSMQTLSPSSASVPIAFVLKMARESSSSSASASSSLCERTH